MSSTSLLFFDEYIERVPLLTQTMKQRLPKYIVVAGVTYLSLPYINQVLNQTLGTNYDTERKTNNYLFGKNLTSRHMKVLRLFYSYVFTDDILETVGVSKVIKLNNEELMAGVNSAVKFLISDVTFDYNETLKDKLVEAFGVFALISTVELTNKLLIKV